MNAIIQGTFWLPVVLSGVVWQWAVDGAFITSSSTSTSGSLMDDFANTLKLSRKLLIKSKFLRHSYLTWKLPGAHLDFAGSHPNIPSVSTSFSFWLRLQAGDRLRLLNEALQVYPVYLQQLEKWVNEEEDTDHDIPSHFKEKVLHVRINLRDLLHHMERQMTSFGITIPKPMTPKSPPTNGNDWCSRVEMYQALRGLEMTMLRA